MPFIEIRRGFRFCIAGRGHTCPKCLKKITEGDLTLRVFYSISNQKFFHPKCFEEKGSDMDNWKETLDRHYKEGLLPKTVIKSLNLK